MGIHGLTKLLGDVAPDVLKETKLASYFGRKVAIDASMFLYSFLVAIRPDSQFQLTDESGETTSHLQGMFNRTVRLVEQGLKPCYVFDGKPPTLKGGELAKRSKKKEAAKEELVEARETGNQEEADKIVKRTVRVTAKHNEECKKLLRLMGIPVVEAPCEAEAQCAALCRVGKVFATGTEDMDALTLGTPILLRHLTYAEARKMPILEIHLNKVLDGLNLTMDQFIDVCILCGCDYCDSIKGIGPKRALEYITKYGSIEGMLPHLDKTKYPLPERFDYESVRLLFKESEVTNAEEVELKWTDPDEEGLKQFLVTEKQFSLERVEKAIERLKKQRNAAVQGRLDSFFGPPTIVPNKRKREEEAKAKAKAKGKGKGKEPAGKRGRR